MGDVGVLATVDVVDVFSRRSNPVAALSRDADTLASACLAMARRFYRGGRLIALGSGLAAADAAHVAVEFVHPVIVGKRALPALALPDGGSATSVRLFSCSDDIALAFSCDGAEADLAGALGAAVEDGLLTVALLGGDGGAVAEVSGLDFTIVVPSTDRRVVREAHVTVYHVLWELVHIFLDAPEVLT
jgi:D-sedoheptulose 7-phosphate isomerase